MSHAKKLKRLKDLEDAAILGGGIDKIQKQHMKNKFTARERINILIDDGSFVELDKFVINIPEGGGAEAKVILGDGVVTGYGKVEGRTVFVFAHDFTAFGGSLSETMSKKICKVMDLAIKVGAPIIALNDSGGARIQEGVESLAAYSKIFYRNTMASGVVPQISAILGPSAGGSVYSPAMNDFTIMVDGISHMFITGPDVVKSVVGQDVDFEELGGAMVHSENSGVSHFVTGSEQECMTLIKNLLSYIPQNNSEDPPIIETVDTPDRYDKEIVDIMPEESDKPYDMREIIRKIVDSEEFLEIHALWAPNIIIGFARLDGHSLGVVANQPSYMSGVLDCDASNKAARFVRFCDAFNIQIATFVDVPGYLPGTDQEHQGIIRHGCKLLYAYCESVVPKVTLITRKAYGGAYCAMGSKYSKADINLAWPSAEIAVMGPEAAINVIFRKEIAASKEPDQLKNKLLEDYREKFANPYKAAEKGIIDAVIDPAETRIKIIQAFAMLKDKREIRQPKKHGNIQL